MTMLKLFSLALLASVTVTACTPQAQTTTNTNTSADVMMEKENGDSMEKQDDGAMMEKKDGDTMMQGDEETIMKQDDGAMMEQKATTVTISGGLSDVTGGLDVRGINTQAIAAGSATASFNGSQYSLVAQFTDLPEPQNGDFYEGWVVRQDPVSIVSTGKLQYVDGQYRNTFETNADLTDHTLYVLTLEPNDGDPAPADHIVEGQLQ